MGDYEFKAQTRKVLNILTHSLYTNREIFLRELISNASDALDKVRFMQSRGDLLRDADLPLEIKISVDKVQNCLTIVDTGLGMSKEELIENLGTIAKSGSEEFLASVGTGSEASASGQANPASDASETPSEGEPSETARVNKDAASIIGRFGIGFYSVFMVADKVEVTSLAGIGTEPAHTWTSDGLGSFNVTEASGEFARGTTIKAYLKDDAKEFLESYRLDGVIRTHSNFIPFPILVDSKRINSVEALWREPKFKITKEQYTEFYKFLSYDQEPPLDVLHLSVDAPVQFNALLFIPGITKDYFGSYREHWGPDLYVRRVLIQKENKDLLPEYLAFLKGVVDTEDLPLNISRETLQENIVLRKIAQTLTKNTLSHLERLAKDEPEKYATFWQLHGKVFKLGYSDFVNRDRVAKLLRFNSSALDDAKDLTSLDAYIERAKAKHGDKQKEIWYVAAPSREAAKLNPHLEVFGQKGLEVLYLYEPVDEFSLETLAKYEDYSFKAVEHAEEAVLDGFTAPEQPKAAPLSSEDLDVFTKFLERVKEVLGDQIKDVRVSHRLADSPACLVASHEGITSSMDKLMRVIQKDDSIPQKIFEVNRDHALIRTMLKIYKADTKDGVLAEMVQSLFDSSLLLDGFLKDPHMLASRTNKLLEEASAWYVDVKKI